MLLTHGGQLNSVANEFGLDSDGWLDLSTGISPFSYPIGDIPETIWRRLPEVSDGLINAACQYYQAKKLLAINGSQAIIQLFPRLWLDTCINKIALINTRVLVPRIGYKEHQKSWSDAGFKIEYYDSLPEEDDIKDNTILVVINPNNPMATITSKQQLFRLKNKLQQNSGWLIIDEAFMDIKPKTSSMMKYAEEDGVFVLRSIGKFFGLAGLRVGFIGAHSRYLERIQLNIGQWQVNAPAIYITEKALNDTQWHAKQLTRLTLHSQLLFELLVQYFDLNTIYKSELFITVFTPSAKAIYHRLCLVKVYVRLDDDEQWLRFGLVKQTNLPRLNEALAIILRELV